MRILVGDIGGTKTELAVAEPLADGVRLADQRRYLSRAFASLAELLADYLNTTGARCEAGSLAVAGPVMDGFSRTTNLPWEIDSRALATRLGLPEVLLLNDLEAVAWGVAALGAEDLAVLQPGAPGAVGNACVVAAGTGLGQAGLYWDGQAHHPFATEGGHTDFAATDELEFALLQYLQAKVGRVSWERVVSGMGLADLYQFTASRHGGDHAAAVAAALAGDGDVAAAVATAASQGCPLSHETMRLFARLYGREAGNTALKHMALGGVYLAGGIAPKNLSLLLGPEFLAGFLDKGRMRALMARIPVRVILQQQVPLYGAARFAHATLAAAR